MHRWLSRSLAGLVLAAGLAAGLVCSAVAAPNSQIVGLDASGRVLSIFRKDNPGTILRNVPLNLPAGEMLMGIDFRTATGDLYGVSNRNWMYRIDVASGAAVRVGVQMSPGIEGTVIGLDFNPTVDRIRLITNTGQNLRLNPDTGGVAAVDANLRFANDDVNRGRTPRVTAGAYTNPENPSAGTQLWDIDWVLGLLLTQNPPNDGVLNTIGSLGVAPRANIGFDIHDGNQAVMTIQERDYGPSVMYTVNLANGRASRVGQVGPGQLLTDIAICLNNSKC